MWGGKESQQGRLRKARAVLQSVEQKRGLQAVSETISFGWAGGIFEVGSEIENLIGALRYFGEDDPWICVIGWSEIGWEAAWRHGVNTDKVVVIPSLAEDKLSVAHLVVDVFDLVAIGEIFIPPTYQRVLAARAHLHERTVLTAYSWPHISQTFSGKRSQGSWGKGVAV